MRAVSWRLLSKYLPPSGERRNAVLESKRQGYQDLRLNYFKVDSQDESQQDTYRQVSFILFVAITHIQYYRNDGLS